MSNPNNIDCEEAIKRLFDFLDHEIDPTHRAEVEHHLESCRACYSRAEFEKRLKGKLGALGEEKVPETFEQRLRSLLDGY